MDPSPQSYRGGTSASANHEAEPSGESQAEASPVTLLWVPILIPQKGARSPNGAASELHCPRAWSRRPACAGCPLPRCLLCSWPFSMMRAQQTSCVSCLAAYPFAQQVPACHFTWEFQPSSVTHGMLCQTITTLATWSPWTTSSIKSVTPKHEVTGSKGSESPVTWASHWCHVLGPFGPKRTEWNPNCLDQAWHLLWLSPHFPQTFQHILPSPLRSSCAGSAGFKPSTCFPPCGLHMSCPQLLWCRSDPSMTDVSFSSSRAQLQLCFPLCFTGQNVASSCEGESGLCFVTITTRLPTHLSVAWTWHILGVQLKESEMKLLLRGAHGPLRNMWDT